MYILNLSISELGWGLGEPLLSYLFQLDGVADQLELVTGLGFGGFRKSGSPYPIDSGLVECEHTGGSVAGQLGVVITVHPGMVLTIALAFPMQAAYGLVIEVGSSISDVTETVLVTAYAGPVAECDAVSIHMGFSVFHMGLGVVILVTGGVRWLVNDLVTQHVEGAGERMRWRDEIDGHPIRGSDSPNGVSAYPATRWSWWHYGRC